MKKNLFLNFGKNYYYVLIAIWFWACMPENSPELDNELDVEIIESLSLDHEPDFSNFRTNTPAQNKAVADIRAGTAKYHRVEVAESAGYELASPCVTRPGLGAMGFHYVNFSLIDTNIDPRNPEVLLFEPQKNGILRLVAVEFIVPAIPWHETHDDDDPPTLEGQVFDDHRDFTKGGPRYPHYQLHVWVWKHNPVSIFTPYNPDVTCDYQ
ncbi:hypothetical protein [Aquiflexum sp.]|uniref:hypothetical protein n=1 Tax=Aquiflexum sp. TaxID=1872584 RepID=UPI003592F8A6